MPLHPKPTKELTSCQCIQKMSSTVDLVISNQAPSSQLDKEHAVITYFQGDNCEVCIRTSFPLLCLNRKRDLTATGISFC